MKEPVLLVSALKKILKMREKKTTRKASLAKTRKRRKKRKRSVRRKRPKMMRRRNLNLAASLAVSSFDHRS